jgi:hypothetical protein
MKLMKKHKSRKNKKLPRCSFFFNIHNDIIEKGSFYGKNDKGEKRVEKWYGAAGICVNEDGALLMVLQGKARGSEKLGKYLEEEHNNPRKSFHMTKTF